MFSGIPSHFVENVWDEVEPWIKRACERGGDKYTPEDIKGHLVNQEMQLWTYRDDELRLVCVTEIVNYPRKKYARIFIATGKDREKWLPFMSVIKGWAKAQGCDGIETFARRGWFRAFYKKAGWEHTHEIIEMEL